MEKTALENRIEQRATARFEKDVEQALVIACKSPVLARLRVGKLNLVSEYGHCPSTDLFHKGDRTLLRKETNIRDIRAELIQKYIQEETDELLANVALLAEFLQRA